MGIQMPEILAQKVMVTENLKIRVRTQPIIMTSYEVNQGCWSARGTHIPSHVQRNTTKMINKLRLQDPL